LKDLEKYLLNLTVSLGELQKWDYSTSKCRPQLESKFTNGWNP